MDSWSSSALTDRRSSVGRSEVDVRSRVRKHEVDHFRGFASISDVGDKHSRPFLEGCLRCSRSSLDRDSRAVHVHLAISNPVKPSPSENSLSSWCIDASLTSFAHRLEWLANPKGLSSSSSTSGRSSVIKPAWNIMLLIQSDMMREGWTATQRARRHTSFREEPCQGQPRLSQYAITVAVASR